MSYSFQFLNGIKDITLLKNILNRVQVACLHLQLLADTFYANDFTITIEHLRINGNLVIIGLKPATFCSQAQYNNHYTFTAYRKVYYWECIHIYA